MEKVLIKRKNNSNQQKIKRRVGKYIMTEPIKFENASISIFQQDGLNGKPSRRVFIAVEDLAAVPDELFAIKMSQSRNPELAGKAVFKYFSYKVSKDAPFSALAPTGTTVATPTAETKAAVMAKLGALPDVEFSIAMNMNGQFGNIKTPEGVYTIFDDKEFPATQGKPGYYLKSGTLATVTLTLAQGQHSEYYQVALATDSGPADIFVTAGKSKVWGAGAADTTPAVDAGATDELSGW